MSRRKEETEDWVIKSVVLDLQNDIPIGSELIAIKILKDNQIRIVYRPIGTHTEVNLI